MKLTVISHTEHYKRADGTIVGWGPTINELNYLAKEFDEITHVAMLHSGTPPLSSLPYTSSNIKFVPLPVLGGKTVLSKLKLLVSAFKIISIVSEEIKKSDVFQLRTPTGIGVFLIPYLTLFVKTKGWYKYAGNWTQENPPLGYRLQRWMLKLQKRIVTINGKWNNQPSHVVAFENPCLTEEDRAIGETINKHKKLAEPYNYCFVGGLNTNKGIDKIITAFKTIQNDKMGTFHVVGDGHLQTSLEQKAKEASIPVIIHGALSKTKVQEIYKIAHFIILPSLSEGFPKVIGEAMNYGCIPIVSDISCIGQYVKNNVNGFLIAPITVEKIKMAIVKSLASTPTEFTNYIAVNYDLAHKFTYTYYLKRIKEEILKDH